MNENEITELARQIRLETLKSLTQLGFGHYGGSMSVVETLAVLYGAVMKIDPADPDWPERDYFVLSKGHAGPALYSTLAIKGYFPIEELSTLNQNGTRLPSHPDRLKTRGVDATTGSLGQGISIAGGMALSHKLAGRPNRVLKVNLPDPVFYFGILLFHGVIPLSRFIKLFLRTCQSLFCFLFFRFYLFCLNEEQIDVQLFHFFPFLFLVFLKFIIQIKIPFILFI